MLRRSSLNLTSERVNSRRSQMSEVFHSVRTTEPGVPLEPNPPGPSRQPLASKPGSDQLAAGFSVVYRHWTGSFCEVGESMVIFGSGGNWPRFAAATVSTG